MPDSICIAMMFGLTAMPQSTDADHAVDLVAGAVFETSATSATTVPNDSCSGDATVRSGRQRLAPPGLLGGEFEHGQVARMLGEQAAAQLERILLRRLRDFVEEALDGIGGVGRAHRTPPLDRHADLRGVQFDLQVRDRVGQVGRAFDRACCPPVRRCPASVPAMIDWPTMRCCQPMILPPLSRPALNECTYAGR